MNYIRSVLDDNDAVRLICSYIFIDVYRVDFGMLLDMEE